MHITLNPQTPVHVQVPEQHGPVLLGSLGGPPEGHSNLIFLEARGVCGKTYVMIALLAVCRAMGMVASASCFTGLASQDYAGGTTLHRLQAACGGQRRG